MLSQSEIIKRAIERVADAEIEKKTAPCFRTYKAIVTEAPNGTTCKVRLIGDDTELTLPYASKLSEITAGKFVWVGAFYNVDNSFSNAIVWETLKMDVGGGGGSTVTVDDALSTTSTNPVQNRVITNTVNGTIGSWTPDFASLKPISTHEFDIASTSYFKICERPNVTTITDIADEVLAFRITVTGTGIFAIADVLVRMQPTVNIRPLVTVNYQTQSTSAGTTGVQYLRTVNPKAANTSYKYEIAVAAYNTTSRHIKVEVFKAPTAWVFSSAATAYSYNSTYQTANDLTLYTNVGVLYNYTFYATASYANYAGYKSSWDGLFNSQGNFLNAGAAIAANQFVFIGKDNKVYPTTSTAVEIDPAWPIVHCTTAVASGAAVEWSYLRSWGYFTPASSILKDGTLIAKDTVYMRCTYTNGKLYSANTMTQTLTSGNTYIKLGKMYSATAVSVNTYNSEFFTLDTDGHIKALNGYLFNAAKADTATAVSKSGLTSAGTYGVLLDSNQITDIIHTTTSPGVNAGLTFNPSTGNLSSTVFTGSGAGLTNVPSSGINYDELPTIADYAGPSGSGRFVTFLQNESDDPYTHPYLLEAPNAMTYRVGTDSMVFANGVGLRRYKLGFYGARYSNTNNTSTFWATCLKTPIEIDPNTHIPTNSLIVDGAKMTFRFYGDVTYTDASSDYFDTYFTLCYQNQNGSGNWSVYYETRGDIHYGASITYSDNRVAIVIGWAYDESTYNKHLQNFKAYRYVDSTVDHLGSTLGYASGKSDYCKLIENRSNWSAIAWQGNASESWSDVLSQVYATGRIEGIRGNSSQDDGLLPTKLLHVYHDAENDSYSFTDSLTEDEIIDILDTAFDGEINLNVQLSDVDFIQLLKYYYTSNLMMMKILMFELSPVGGIDQSTMTNNALQSYFAIAYMDGADPSFRFMVIEGANLATLSQQLMQLLAGKEDLSNKVTSVDSTSTDDQYPSAKAVYDAIQGDNPVEDTDVFISRASLFSENKYKSAKLVGGTVVFNQLGNATIPAGTYTFNTALSAFTSYADHIYLATTDRKELSLRFRNITTGLVSNSGITIITKISSTYAGAMTTVQPNGTSTSASKINIFDLTLMLGKTIADRIYALETATSGSGVAWFKKYFPKDYYPYDTGTLVSVCPTGMASNNNMWNNDNYQLLSGSHITKIGATSLIVSQVGYQGRYNTYPITQTSSPIALEFDYKVTRSNDSRAKFVARIYGDSNKSATVRCSNVGFQGHIALVSDNNPTAIKFDEWAYDGTVEITNIFVRKADEQKKDALYEISPLELYGYPSLDSNDNLVYDGDIRESNGTVTRKYAKINLNAFTGAWGATSNGYAVYYVNYGLKRSSQSICSGFTYSNKSYSDMPVMTWCGGSGVSETFSFILPSTVTSLAEANAWLASNPISFIAKTSSEHTESTYPFKSPQLVYSGETESFIDDRDVPMPVGQIAEYMDNFDAVEDAALADSGNFELLSRKTTTVDSSSTDDQYPSAKAVYDAISTYDSHMATLAYTATGVAFSNNALTIPIDGTQYKILQMNIFNNDLTYGLGWPRTFIFNASGTNGYIENTSMYCIASSAASGITVTFDSSWATSASTNVDITVLYRRIN